MTIESIVPIASLVVALLAIIVGPYVSHKISSRQVRSSEKLAHYQVVKPMRQAWINKLRDRTSDFIGVIYEIAVVQSAESRPNEENFKRLIMLKARVSMMLNESEDDHKKLDDLLQKTVISSYNKDKDSAAELGRLTVQIESLAKKILKTEWNRVKNRS